MSLVYSVAVRPEEVIVRSMSKIREEGDDKKIFHQS